MKFTARILLIILFIPIFFIALLTASFKYRILSPVFWQNTFSSNNVYSNLANGLKKTVEGQIANDTDSKNDAKILTDLITENNVKKFIDENINNILQFADGKSNNLFIYIPYKIIPDNMLPRNLVGTSEMMTIDSFLNKFNVTSINSDQIKYFSTLGSGANYLLISTLAILVIFLLLLYIMSQSGGRLINPAIPLIISGVLTLSFVKIGTTLKTGLVNSFSSDASFSQIVFSSVIPPLFTEIFKFWALVGITFVLIGIVLIFLKKP